MLRLRGASASHHLGHDPSTSSRRRIQWAEDVVDNEGLGRKKSKVCCIFHKNREVGESSDESDGSNSSSSGSDESERGDDGAARMSGSGGKRARRHPRPRRHGGDGDGDDACAPGHGHDHAAPGKGKRKPSPNAYEKMPRYSVKQAGGA